MSFSGKSFLNRMTNAETFLEAICKPLLVYGVVMGALITYNATKGDASSLLKNITFLFIGSGLIWVLCRMGFEMVAWVLLSLPVFFVIALLALLVITQIVRTDVTYDDGSGSTITGDSIRDMLGLGKNIADTGTTNGDMSLWMGPTRGECVDDTVPTPPRMNAGDKIRLQMSAASCAAKEAAETCPPPQACPSPKCGAPPKTCGGPPKTCGAPPKTCGAPKTCPHADGYDDYD